MFCTLPKRRLADTDSETVETYCLSSGNYSMRVGYQLAPLRTLWDTLAPAHNLFLQSDYLLALETHPPAGMSFCYVVFYEDDKPVGISYNQIFYIDAAESIQRNDEAAAAANANANSAPARRACLLDAVRRSVRNWVIRRSRFELLIGGNILLTGAHGYYLPSLDAAAAMSLVRDSLDMLPQIIKEDTGRKISLNFLKDYPSDSAEALRPVLEKNSYYAFSLQPCMRMPLRPHWHTFDDYMNDMQSKHRTRLRRAQKKGQEIEKRELSVEEIEQNIETIHQLYRRVADGVGFNAFVLHERYFLALKQQLGERFRLVAYYLEGRMIAFYTAILNGEELEAHFLGFDASTNAEYQTYLNILFDLVRAGIYHGKKVVDFARTALEIKSSVGAQAQEMTCFLRHRNMLSNRLLQWLIHRFNPKEVWQERHPFKGSNAETAEVEA